MEAPKWQGQYISSKHVRAPTQVQEQLITERAAREKVESDFAQKAASHATLAAELARVSAAMRQKESIEEELRHCRLHNQDLLTSTDRLSQELIDAVRKLDEEKQRAHELRDSESHQTSVCLVTRPSRRAGHNRSG